MMIKQTYKILQSFEAIPSEVCQVQLLIILSCSLTDNLGQYTCIYIRGEPHSWWIWPHRNIVSRLYVVCTTLSLQPSDEHPFSEFGLELNALSWLHSSYIKMTLFVLSLVTIIIMPPILTATYTHHVMFQ